MPTNILMPALSPSMTKGILEGIAIRESTEGVKINEVIALMLAVEEDKTSLEARANICSDIQTFSNSLSLRASLR